MLMDRYNKTVAYQRADACRSIEYMRNMMEDAALSERICEVEESSRGYNEAVDQQENEEIMAAFTADGDENKEEEINRIIDSTEDISFDEMLGITQNAGDIEKDTFAESVLSVELYTEGTNKDATAALKYLKKNVMPEVRKAKKFIRKKDAKNAKACLKSASEKLKVGKKMMDAVVRDDSIAPTVIGWMLYSVMVWFKEFVSTLATLPILGLGGFATVISEFIRFIQDTGMKVVNAVKAGKFTASDINLWVNKIDGIFARTDTLIQNLMKSVDAIVETADEPKKDKKEKAEKK